MKNSIEKKYALTFSIIIGAIMFICWCANALLLSRVYIADKESTMRTVFSRLDNATKEYAVDSDNFLVIFENIANETACDILILNQDMEVVVSNVPNEDEASGRFLSNFFYGNKQARVLYKNSKYTLQIENSNGKNRRFIELFGVLSTGNPIAIRTAVVGIKDNAKVANMLLAYIAVLGVLFGYFLISYISKSITKPILDMVDISDKMAKLDFDAKYTGEDDSEIGLLGEHMNYLSSTLEKTVSELKSANNELKRELKKREEIDKMRTDFISNVSHELKTPIALIQGYAEGLELCVNDDDESRNFYCEVIGDEAKKMDSLVKNLLRLNELEYAGSVNIERIDIVEFVKNCISNMDLLIKQNDINVSFEYDEPIYVWTDPERIEYVVNNYLSNAVHYVKGDDKLIKITIASDIDKVRVSVFNSGDPIPEDALPRLFEKFYKVDKARTREYGGSGVGLSIVKASMDALNQKYGVINHENGVEFYFEVDSNNI